MIIDRLCNYKTYLSIHPRFDKAFQFLVNNNLSGLPDGRTDIDGDDIYVIVSRGPLRKAEDASIEIHNSYMDIQVVIEGRETFGWKERSALLLPSGDFDEGKDIRFFYDSPETFYTVGNEEMSIFFPHDGHAPMIGEGRVVKCVVKVRV